jgi:AraC-like DNA-binding protein
MSSLVRAASLTHYAEVARQAGLNPDRLMLDAGLEPSVLLEPDLIVPVDRVRRLLQSSARLSADDAFGLRMAATRQLSNLGPVGMVIRDQPTVRESLIVLKRYHAALNGALVMHLEQQAGLVLIREELLYTGTAQSARQSIELAIGVLFVTLRQLLGTAWRPQRVCFAHTAPRNLAFHLQLFGPCLEFGHDFNGVACLASELDAPSPGADPEMIRYAQRLLEATAIAGEVSPVDEVRRTIALLLPGGRCSIERVAAQLGLLPRTVQRRLAEQDRNFSDLVNEMRAELAQRHVVQGGRPLTDVASLLGFAALSGFSRWYQHQFHCSPSQRRAARA